MFSRHFSTERASLSASGWSYVLSMSTTMSAVAGTPRSYLALTVTETRSAADAGAGVGQVVVLDGLVTRGLGDRLLRRVARAGAGRQDPLEMDRLRRGR